MESNQNENLLYAIKQIAAQFSGERRFTGSVEFTVDLRLIINAQDIEEESN